MNKATGTQKIDDLAAVVNKLVAQREEVHQLMLAMQSSMLRQTAGGSAAAAQSSAGCPMMKGKSGLMGAGSAKAENNSHSL